MTTVSRQPAIDSLMEQAANGGVNWTPKLASGVLGDAASYDPSAAAVRRKVESWGLDYELLRALADVPAVPPPCLYTDYWPEDDMLEFNSFGVIPAPESAPSEISDGDGNTWDLHGVIGNRDPIDLSGKQAPFQLVYSLRTTA
jgi:hypothetical protein